MFLLFLLLTFGLPVHSLSLSPLGHFPLAVKTPYLHCWDPSSNQRAPHNTWANLFRKPDSADQRKILGWEGIIRVDDVVYEWLGNDHNFPVSAETLNSQITPTRTMFTIQAGPVIFNATFFTPIEINDYIRQSIPFTYLFVDGFTANDTKPHNIQLYSDITAEWVSSSTSTEVKWDGKILDSSIYLHFDPPGRITANTDSPEDATAVYAMGERSGLTWEIGLATELRKKFAQQGSLANSSNDEFRPVDQNGGWPVLSFAIDLGLVTPNSQPLAPVVWALGLVRDPLVKYATQSGAQDRIGYYKLAYQNMDQLVIAFLGDFEDARSRGQAFDDDIIKAASSISSEYVEIISLVTRQVFASMDITIPAESGGRLSASDVKIFMKDTSMSTRVNPVEVIYGALPALLNFNASFVHDLLLPLFEVQLSSSYPYASSDLGNKYPVVDGGTNHDQGHAIEQCGNMLIMTYAHAAKSGDGSLISNPEYHSLLETWANYLVQNSLHTNNSVSADGIGYSGMSNLALKGILGIYSMGKINEALKSSNTTFRDKATELFKEWEQLAVTDTHVQAQYGQSSTWGLMYNLFPAVWLETGLFDDDFLNREAQFYLSNTPPQGRSYSLDNVQGDDLAYPHWALMTAAVIPPNFTSVRDSLIKSTHNQAYNKTQLVSLPITYSASTGDAINGSLGSAIQGAAFAILAKGKPNVPIVPVILQGHKKTPVGAIAGGIIGGVAFLIVAGAILFWWYRRSMRQHKVVIDPYYEEEQAKMHPSIIQRALTNNNNTTSQLPKQNVDAKLRPSNQESLEPRSKSQNPGESYSSSRGNNYTLLATTPPVQSSRPSHNGGDASQQNQSEPSESAPLYGQSTARPERGETWRAEVEELRREMEAIRNMAQPPPSYE